MLRPQRSRLIAPTWQRIAAQLVPLLLLAGCSRVVAPEDTLHAAAARADVEAIAALGNAALDLRDPDGATALHVAAASGSDPACMTNSAPSKNSW